MSIKSSLIRLNDVRNAKSMHFWHELFIVVVIVVASWPDRVMHETFTLEILKTTNDARQTTSNRQRTTDDEQRLEPILVFQGGHLRAQGY